MAYVEMIDIKPTRCTALACIARGDARQGGVYVSTNAALIDLSDHNVVGAMMADASERAGNGSSQGSVLAHHVIQSFDPSETFDAETAHLLPADIDKVAQFSRSFDEQGRQLWLAGSGISRHQGSLSFCAENQKRSVHRATFTRRRDLNAKRA